MKNMNKSTVFVTCASDRNFVIPLVVMLKSLLTNFKNNRKIVIYILTKDLKYFYRKKILKSLKMERADIRFVYINDNSLKKLKVTAHITVTAYYRLLMPMVLPKELKKVIYLDSDLIVNTDIGKLWDLDIGQNYILAVPEQGKNCLYVSSPGGLLNYKELGIDPTSKQFNSGVMLINLDRWRKDNISQEVIEYLEQNKEKVRWWDQDGLNAVLAGKWGEIDHRWNLLTQIFSNLSWEDGPIKEKEMYKELINHPYIVHFNTSSKPWHIKSNHPYKNLFFHYLTMAKWLG
jgi:lipopolysaccharide biosynthesis glycosyltransferase